MRKAVVLLTVIFAVTTLGWAQQQAAPQEEPAVQPHRYEVKGQFSFTYPAGWQKFARPNAADQLEWLVIPGNTDTFFSPMAAHADVPIDKWVEDTIKKTASEKRVLLAKNDFTTDSGEKGMKLRWKRTTDSGRELLIDQYFFTNKSTQLLFTGIALFSEAEKFESVFDANMKSLVVAK